MKTNSIKSETETLKARLKGLNRIDEELDEMRSKIRSEKKEAVKDSLERKMDEMETRYHDLVARAKTQATSSEKAFKELKSGFEKAWGNLKDSIDKASNKLH